MVSRRVSDCVWEKIREEIEYRLVIAITEIVCDIVLEYINPEIKKIGFITFLGNRRKEFCQAIGDIARDNVPRIMELIREYFVEYPEPSDENRKYSTVQSSD